MDQMARLSDIEQLEQQAFNARAWISVQPMLGNHKLRDSKEDWTGKTSTAVRRKLQNRLNQRASRQRRAQISNSTTLTSTGSAPQEETTHNRGLVFQPNNGIITRFGPLTDVPICIDPHERQIITSAPSFSSFLKYPLPTDQKLLTLLHFNVVRALTQIVHVLGYNPDDMDKDVPSMFHSNPTIDTSNLPASLQPTALQTVIPHHPEIDIMPFPVFRDNMLLASPAIGDVEFCSDLLYGVELLSEDTRKTHSCKDGSLTGRTEIVPPIATKFSITERHLVLPVTLSWINYRTIIDLVLDPTSDTQDNLKLVMRGSRIGDVVRGGEEGAGAKGSAGSSPVSNATSGTPSAEGGWTLRYKLRDAGKDSDDKSPSPSAPNQSSLERIPN
ncbi:hypothetical protein G7Y89_g3663 [Cudoniella acicularis]|uniref:BZIP domain-containing protein n=1 Tax=Cudoniella acicularis TaxID=354080 RepID=A0A8H4W7F8_9HELO|nr:hypothetical protein G7Y89_g3663 [Cudoniella acicularis]